jgi:DNA invertase Pin-like site-specific DNA recombinase
MTGQRIGYVRVSTLDQHPELQLDGIALDRTFTDKASGKDVRRGQLDALLAFVRAGDTVVVHSMDRLARNLDDLRRLVQTLSGNSVRIEFIKENYPQIATKNKSRSFLKLPAQIACEYRALCALLFHCVRCKPRSRT